MAKDEVVADAGADLGHRSGLCEDVCPGPLLLHLECAGEDILDFGIGSSDWAGVIRRLLVLVPDGDKQLAR